jgi:chemotaxis protein methyltransferase CheR
MKHGDYAFLADMLRRRAGLSLGQTRPQVIEGRLAPVMRRFGFRDSAALIAELRHGREALARAVTEAMATNESCFFRDRAVFDQFREIVLPALIERRAASRTLRIWSAACAAGQEAYSIAMTLNERKLRAQGWTVDIIATDLSSDMIARAEQGLYTHFEAQRGLPTRRLIEHFTQDGANWRICDSIRRMITFRQFNLLDSYGWLDEVDVVFCRNVLIYFDHKTKANVLGRIADILAPGGYLMLGPAETSLGLGPDFSALDGAPGVFVKGRRMLQRALAS